MYTVETLQQIIEAMEAFESAGDETDDNRIGITAIILTDAEGGPVGRVFYGEDGVVYFRVP